MNHRILRPLGLVLVLVLLHAAPLAAQDHIIVDAGAPVSDVSRRPIGINVNFLLDDDGNRPEALARLADALKTAGVKYLRYPGGEKADAYLWSVPPFTSSEPALARWASGEWPENQEWPSYDRPLVLPDGHTFRTDPLKLRRVHGRLPRDRLRSDDRRLLRLDVQTRPAWRRRAHARSADRSISRSRTQADGRTGRPSRPTRSISSPEPTASACPPQPGD